VFLSVTRDTVNNKLFFNDACELLVAGLTLKNGKSKKPSPNK
jgi:hypothetical protein